MSSDSIPRTYNKLDLLKLMYLSREGDRREGVLLRQGKGWFQVSGMGHETLSVVSSMMKESDYLFPYYRDRAMVLSKGVSNFELAQAYFAKQSSSSGGRQMPGHYSCRKRNVWSVPTPTGANLLPACGVAWGMQMKNEPGVVVATIGDAATRQGEFYEAVSFAVERALPIVLLVEDNRYGISTNTDQFNPFKLGVFNEDIVTHLDARNPDLLCDATSIAFERAREGGGPTVMVCELDRLCSHTSSDDHRVYRPAEEISEMMDRDPISVIADQLIDAGELTQDHWEQIRQEIDDQVDREYIEAEAEKDPEAGMVMDQLYGNPPVPQAPPIEAARTWRMVDAVNSVFQTGLESDQDFVFFGEDIEDPKGGVFRLTAELSTRFPDRVFNSPLAEATIAGVAIGLASYGMKPIFEIQFIDFSGPAWNQISQNLGSLRWRTNGDWNCPVVLYAPYGAYLPGGSLWHSQANESVFAHVPGIRVVVPSTPEDAAGLMWTAMHTEDPVLYLIPKHLFRQQIRVGDNVEPVPFSSARIRRHGDDVTLVAWGNCMELANSVVKSLGDQVDVELIDLRSIVPWDKKTVMESVEKTGRLEEVQEDGESCSVGQMIISEIAGNPDSFSNLFSSPQLVSKPDVYIGYNPICEYAALPKEEEILAAIRLVMED